MARSQYVYTVRRLGSDRTLGTFTVKHECLDAVERYEREHECSLVIERRRDGDIAAGYTEVAR